MKLPQSLAREAVRFEREVQSREAWRVWIQERIAEIHRRVSVYDVLSKNGVALRYTEGEEQISCPFHGQDRRPSARVYPQDPQSPSHVWCFACNERWDCIGLWKKFEGQEDAKFGAILRGIEEHFGITPPPRPADHSSPSAGEETVNVELEQFESDFRLCESRLRKYRAAFDMTGFLKLCVVLDRLHFQVMKKLVSYSKAESILQRIRNKITEKEAAREGDIPCPDG
jgi:hypothetical protein